MRDIKAWKCFCVSKNGIQIEQVHYANRTFYAFFWKKEEKKKRKKKKKKNPYLSYLFFLSANYFLFFHLALLNVRNTEKWLNWPMPN